MFSRYFPKMFLDSQPSDPTMIGITFAFVFHGFCVSILSSRYFKISSSLSLTFLTSTGSAPSIIVVVRFVLLITTISGLMLVLPCLYIFLSPITLSFPYFLLRALGDVTPLGDSSIMLTYIPVNNFGYSVVFSSRC